MAKRVAQHNGRAGKHGVYLAKHNDRQFDVSQASHIDAEKSAQNIYWSYYNGMNFEACEQKYYEDRFGQALNVQNEKYAQKRQYGYMRTMDEYRQNEKTCPEEQVIYIGDKKDNVGPDLLKKIVEEQIQWERENYPNVVILNYALHVDEQGAPHYHKRQVWEAVDKNGNMIVSQTKALKAMGIGVDKKGTRYDNAKQVYTAQCREHFEGLCRQYGVEITTERLEKSKTGLAIDDYRAQQAQERLAEAEQRVIVAEQREKAMLSQLGLLEQALKTAQEEVEHAQAIARNAEKKAEELERDFNDRLASVKSSSRLNRCLSILNIDEDTSFFGGRKGTYTISKDDFGYLADTISDLDCAVCLVNVKEKEKQKIEKQCKKLEKEKEDLENRLGYYRDIRQNVGPKHWAKVEELSAYVVARKQAITYEVRQQVKANAPALGKDGKSMGD